MRSAEAGVNRQAIVNGTTDSSHPAVIALISVNSLAQPTLAEVCSATLVGIDAGAAQVLTAAHCFYYLDAGWVTLAVMGDDDSDFLDAGVPVREIALHPFYTHGSNGVFLDDFAMARFDAPPGLATIPPLPPALDDLQVGLSVTLVGYGFTDSSSTANTQRRAITQSLWQLDNTLMVFDDHDGGQCQGGQREALPSTSVTATSTSPASSRSATCSARRAERPAASRPSSTRSSRATCKACPR